MYFDIEEFKSCNWDLRRYLKEVSIRSYGLFISLRDDTTSYTEKDLRKHLLEKDKLHDLEIAKRCEIPTKPNEQQIQEEYEKFLERAVESISRNSKNLRDLKQALIIVEKGLERIPTEGDETSLGILDNSLQSLKKHLIEEISSTSEYLNKVKKDLDTDLKEFKENLLGIYQRKLERAQKAAKEEDNWECLTYVYDQYCDLVNSLTMEE